MNKKIRRTGFFLVVVSTIFTVACAGRPGLQSLPPDAVDQANRVTGQSSRSQAPVPQKRKLGRRTSRPLALIAIDMVNALAQVPDMDPGAIIIRTPPARTDFDRAVNNALRAKKYRINSSSTRQGVDVMTTIVVPNVQKPGGIESTYMVSINDVYLRRTYSVIDDVVAPTSSLFVRGADPELIELGDEVFMSQEIRL